MGRNLAGSGWVHPAIVRLERAARAFVPQQLQKHPDHIARVLARRHAETLESDGEPAANRELREVGERVQYMLPPNAGEPHIRQWAQRRAREVRDAIGKVNANWQRYMIAARLVEPWGFAVPEPDRLKTIASCCARMECELWWRRQARTMQGRQHEAEARAIGLVHKRAGLYLSDDAFDRWASRQRENALTLDRTDAVCVETGEAFNLAEIVATGPANPRIRRAELMTRIRGFETVADRRGHVGLFLTWTAPPELHAVSSKSCQPGPGRHVTPRKAQGWLRTRWARSRAEIKREEIPCYGLRVCEPHHDGTPHWHLLLFVPPKYRDQLVELLEKHVIDGDPRPARREHAQRCVTLDPTKGSAAGYVAKYVAKCVDGHEISGILTRDAEGREVWLDRDGADTAARVRAWASTWGIKQFHFFGSPPVTIWREFRRLDAIRWNRTAEAIRQAADRGDWSRYLELMGGPGAPREAHPAQCRKMPDTGVGRYGEPREKLFVLCGGRPYITRQLSWILQYGGPGQGSHLSGRAQPDPWTRGNNCTRSNRENVDRGPPPPVFSPSPA